MKNSMMGREKGWTKKGAVATDWNKESKGRKSSPDMRFRRPKTERKITTKID